MAKSGLGLWADGGRFILDVAPFEIDRAEHELKIAWRARLYDRKYIKEYCPFDLIYNEMRRIYENEAQDENGQGANNAV